MSFKRVVTVIRAWPMTVYNAKRECLEKDLKEAQERAEYYGRHARRAEDSYAKQTFSQYAESCGSRVNRLERELEAHEEARPRHAPFAEAVREARFLCEAVGRVSIEKKLSGYYNGPFLVVNTKLADVKGERVIVKRFRITLPLKETAITPRLARYGGTRHPNDMGDYLCVGNYDKHILKALQDYDVLSVCRLLVDCLINGPQHDIRWYEQ